MTNKRPLRPEQRRHYAAKLAWEIDPSDLHAALEADRRALIVCYCDGIGCNASTKGALKLLDLGFRVKELIGGLEWWKKDGYRARRGPRP